MRKSCLTPFIAFIAASFLASCAVRESTPSAPRSEAIARKQASSRFAEAPTDRPGLGTKWGETRQSRAGFADFERANRAHPIVAAAIYYNDAAGIRAMMGAAALRRTWPILPAPTQSLTSIGLKDQNGRFLPGLIVGDRWFIVGEEGRRYSIVVRNKADLRESYANEKHHDTRNVGVIGIAIFNERGTNPWSDVAVQRRLKANPFPGRFATPP